MEEKSWPSNENNIHIFKSADGDLAFLKNKRNFCVPKEHCHELLRCIGGWMKTRGEGSWKNWCYGSGGFEFKIDDSNGVLILEEHIDTIDTIKTNLFEVEEYYFDKIVKTIIKIEREMKMKKDVEEKKMECRYCLFWTLGDLKKEIRDIGDIYGYCSNKKSGCIEIAATCVGCRFWKDKNFLPKTELEYETEEVIDWIKNYVQESGKKGIVIGLSGGIDSAVVASLCVKALGKDKVVGLILPCFSCDKDSDDAIKVARCLGIDYKIYSLDSILTSFTNLGIFSGNDDADFTVPNIKSRLRMIALYAMANKKNLLVAGTTNKSENVIGYFTKYGDGAVDIEPIIEFLKTEVWEIGKILGVPIEIINKAPSAGLWKGQTDEDEIGVTYQELDKFIYAKEHNGITNLNADKIEKIEKMIRNSQHKKSLPPFYEREQNEK